MNTDKAESLIAESRAAKAARNSTDNYIFLR